MKMAELLSHSTIVPKDFQRNPGNILVAVQWGAELGLKPMQAMQNIAVINGRPSLWGDAVLALVLASPTCKDVIETYEGTGDDYTAVCVAQRHGKADKVGRFSVKDAKAAGLLGKAGPWTQYRDRMLKLRARAFSLRDQFTDVLKGMSIAEEIMDIEPIPPAANTPAAIAAAARPVVQESSERSTLIESLEAVANTGDKKALGIELRKLTKEQRALLGGTEVDRLGKAADDKAAELKAAADEAAASAEAAKATPKDTVAPQGPTYAELMARLNNKPNEDEVHQVLADSGHLPADQIAEIKAACEKALAS